MNARLRLASLAALAALTLTAVPRLAGATGQCDNDDVRVTRNLGHPDYLPDFAAGKLGVVFSGFPRAFLATAYLTLNGVHLDRATQDAVVGMWLDRNHVARVETGPDPVAAWTTARKKIAGAPAPAALDVYSGDSNCLADTFLGATRTLERLRQQPGFTAAELADWATAQDQVFAFCAFRPARRADRSRPPCRAARQRVDGRARRARLPDRRGPLLCRPPPPRRRSLRAHRPRQDLAVGAVGAVSVGAGLSPLHPLRQRSPRPRGGARGPRADRRRHLGARHAAPRAVPPQRDLDTQAARGPAARRRGRLASAGRRLRQRPDRLPPRPRSPARRRPAVAAGPDRSEGARAAPRRRRSHRLGGEHAAGTQ